MGSILKIDFSINTKNTILGYNISNRYRGFGIDKLAMNTKNNSMRDQGNREAKSAHKRYWRKNLQIMTILLIVWACASLGYGVLFADWLNQFRLPFTGFPLGFWFAQQGSIIIFVLCILTYCLLMNALDRKYQAELQALRNHNGH